MARIFEGLGKEMYGIVLLEGHHYVSSWFLLAEYYVKKEHVMLMYHCPACYGANFAPSRIPTHEVTDEVEQIRMLKQKNNCIDR